MKIKLVTKIFDWLSIKENLIKIILWLTIIILYRILVGQFEIKIDADHYGSIDVDLGNQRGGLRLDVDHGRIDVDLGNQRGGLMVDVDISK
jgi:hypothetical protein